MDRPCAVILESRAFLRAIDFPTQAFHSTLLRASISNTFISIAMWWLINVDPREAKFSFARGITEEGVLFRIC